MICSKMLLLAVVLNAFLFVFRDVIFCKLVAMCSFGDFYAERWIWKRSFLSMCDKGLVFLLLKIRYFR